MNEIDRLWRRIRHKQLDIERLREEQRLAHEWSKVAIVIGAVLLILIAALKATL